MKTSLPALPFESWKASKETLHLFTQIVGKIRLSLAPPRNHWWHVSLRVSPRGLTTGLVPHADDAFEIEFDFVDHGVDIRSASGARTRIPLREGLTVAAFHGTLFSQLAALGIRPRILAKPYDVPFAKVRFASDKRHASYDPGAVAKFGTILRWTAGVLERFAGGHVGKTSPVHFFWHSFDLALTRFSGRRAAPIEGANAVTREAYSHEVASFGFWPGDDYAPSPAFYAYAAPVPAGLRDEPLKPRAAKWNSDGGQARLPYDAVRTARDPGRVLLDFWRSVDRAARKRADWAAAGPRAVVGVRDETEGSRGRRSSK